MTYIAQNDSDHYCPIVRRASYALVVVAFTALASCSSGSGGGPGGGTPSFTVSTSAGSGGGISPASVSVNQGSTASFTVTPDEGYSVQSVSGCAGSLSGNTYTTGTITGACQVAATFQINSYTVTATAGLGGEIEPSALSVDHGDSAEFTVTAIDGYAVVAVTGCSGTLSGNSYTTGQITGDCSVEATFDNLVSAPQAVSAVAGDSSVTLTWSEVPAATAYTVYWSQAPDIDPNFSSTFDDLITPADSPHVVAGLVNGTTYYFVVTASLGEEESNPSEEVSATPAPFATWRGPLNDTGITLCGDYAFDTTDLHDNDVDCAAAGATATVAGTDADGDPVPAGQDAHFGRDAVPGLVKVGDGAAGFDFSRVCNSGQVAGAGSCPAEPAHGDDLNDWACTLDNHTGLMWETKRVVSVHLRSTGAVYSWYSSSERSDGTAGEMNDGNPGTANGGNCFNQHHPDSNPDGNHCDTAGYVAAINATGLCGATDWRMPTRTELQSIVHAGTNDPTIDTEYFPGTVSAWYWTGTPHAAGNNGSSATAVNFDQSHWATSSVGQTPKSSLIRVRLVRTHQ